MRRALRGMPERCTCGEPLRYERTSAGLFAWCEGCTPVVEVDVDRLFEQSLRAWLALRCPEESFSEMLVKGS